MYLDQKQKKICRIDYLFIPNHFLNQNIIADISSIPKADHRIIKIEITFENSIDYGPGLWKMSTSHLADPIFTGNKGNY